MSERSHLENEIIPFLMKREYRLIRELGEGACGKTVLLYDELIDEHFVCKKYAPYTERRRIELYNAFVRETKLLYKVHHENVVRVFNHFLYPEQCAGFILMEYIEGKTISDHIRDAPEKINELFEQSVQGFAYLHRHGILHRDIRVPNLMVRTDGRLKIIDLGFGKLVAVPEDFDKSITLNWWCETPVEFENARYDFGTEVYFVGKLFERLIQDHSIEAFKNKALLGRMCQRNPVDRIASFVDVETEIQSERYPAIDFEPWELEAYRGFADSIQLVITKIERNAEFVMDMQQIATQLADAYRSCMLEEFVPNPSAVVRCFVHGSYYYGQKQLLSVECLKDFLQLIQAAPQEKRRIILANLHSKLSAVPRYHDDPDIPF
jgi:eukaryotic-like serine/threonine-protein kinase